MLKYSAGLVSQSFWFVEFKNMTKLVYDGKSLEEIKNMCVEDNIFGAVSDSRKIRMYGYLQRRVKVLDKELVKIFIDSDVSTQKLINIYTVMKTDRLFFDFLYEVYREKIMLGINKIDRADINIFFKNKEIQNDSIANWTDKTKNKLASTYISFLRDANLITSDGEDKKTRKPILSKNFEDYLVKNNLDVVIKALTGVK